MLVHIRVVEAKDLPKFELIHKSSASVTVSLTNNLASHKTSIIPNKKKPFWNDLFTLSINKNHTGVLNFLVNHNSSKGPVQIGYVDIDLSQVEPYKINDDWFKLKGVKEKSKNAPSIHLVFQIADMNSSPFETVHKDLFSHKEQNYSYNSPAVQVTQELPPQKPQKADKPKSEKKKLDISMPKISIPLPGQKKESDYKNFENAKPKQMQNGAPQFQKQHETHQGVEQPVQQQAHQPSFQSAQPQQPVQQRPQSMYVQQPNPFGQPQQQQSAFVQPMQPQQPNPFAQQPMQQQQPNPFAQQPVQTQQSAFGQPMQPMAGQQSAFVQQPMQPNPMAQQRQSMFVQGQVAPIVPRQYGPPQPQPQQQNVFGQPQPQQPQQNMFGQPQQPQPQQNMFGQPQQNVFGQPQPQQVAFTQQPADPFAGGQPQQPPRDPFAQPQAVRPVPKVAAKNPDMPRPLPRSKSPPAEPPSSAEERRRKLLALNQERPQDLHYKVKEYDATTKVGTSDKIVAKIQRYI